jgi:hypothetical protein
MLPTVHVDGQAVVPPPPPVPEDDRELEPV